MRKVVEICHKFPRKFECINAWSILHHPPVRVDSGDRDSAQAKCKQQGADLVLPLCHLYEPQDERTARTFDFSALYPGVGGPVSRYPGIFRRLFLGSIDASDSESRLIFSHFSRSTDSTQLSN